MEDNRSGTKKVKHSEKVVLAARKLLIGALDFDVLNGTSFEIDAIREADIILSPDVNSNSYYITGFLRSVISNGSVNTQVDFEKRLQDLVHYYEVVHVIESSGNVSFKDMVKHYKKNKEKFLQGVEIKWVIEDLLKGLHNDYLESLFSNSDFSQDFNISPLPRHNGMLIPSNSVKSDTLTSGNHEQLIGKSGDGSKDSLIRNLAKKTFKYSSAGIIYRASKRRKSD